MDRVRVSSPQLQQRAPNLIHTSFYKTFFLLRTEITVNGEPAQVGVDKQGWLTLYSRDQKFRVTFDSLVTDVNSVLQQHGLHGVSNYWCEEVPLFELRGTSKGELKKLLGSKGIIWEEFASKINTRMRTNLQNQESAANAPPDESIHVIVVPQLYLIIPDYDKMDGKPILVTSANFSECMTLFCKSYMFDFGAIFRAQANRKTEDTGPANLAVLHAELYEVVNWYELGLALLVPDTELRTIYQDNPRNTVMCRSAMLSWWWDNTETPTWSTLVHALSKSGRHNLATMIATHYGVPLPQRKQASAVTSPILKEEHSNMDVIATLSAIITELKCDRDKRVRELAERNRSWQAAEKERRRAGRQIEKLKHTLSKYQSRIRELLSEKDDMNNIALKVIQFELNSLYQTATEQMEEIELKRQSIDEKERKISQLKHRLDAVEKELEETNVQIPALKEDLRRVEGELENKSERVEEMRKSANDMQLLLNMNHRVLDDYLMQQTAANVSHDRYLQEVKVINLKETSDMTIREYEAFHRLLKIDNPQLKTLFTLLSPRKTQSTNPPSPPGLKPPSAGATRGDLQVELNERLSQALVESGQQPAEEQTTTATREPRSVLSCLEWRKKRKAPQAMVRGAAAVYGQTVYVVGENFNMIHCYSVRTDEWSPLSIVCPHINPGLVFVKSVLIAVGGQLNGQSTAKLTSFKNREWTHELPPMKHPHTFPSVQNLGGNYIIVAAGSWDSDLSMVEIYSIHTGHWFSFVPLPKPFFSITTTICDNQYIVMDGGGRRWVHLFNVHYLTRVVCK